MKKPLLIAGIVMIAFAIIIAIVGVSASNKEVRLRSSVEAQKKVIEGYYDKLWKIIAQKAQVAEQYKNAFKDIYPALIEGRYGNEKGGSLLKMITESNPSFDISLYKDLNQSIEAERTGFFMQQELLVDKNREHFNLRNTWPGSWFVGSRPDIKITIISSDATKKVMETGKENDIDLFKPAPGK